MLKGLQRGISIIGRAPPVTSAAPRLLLSAGLTTAGAAGLDPREYAPDAIVPRGPWRMPEFEEIKALMAGPRDRFGWIRLVTIPGFVLTAYRAALGYDNFAKKFQTANVGDIPSTPMGPSDILFLAQQGGFQEVHTAFLTMLGTRGAEIYREAATLQAHPAGLLTTGLNAETGFLTGLRVDNFFHAVSADRRQRPNALCLNIGTTPRRLLYVNTDIDRMAELDLLPPSAAPDLTSLLRAFVARYPDYPVASLLIEPGQACFAPTECLFHDGSTEGAKGIDVMLTLRGTFGAEILDDFA